MKKPGCVNSLLIIVILGYYSNSCKKEVPPILTEITTTDVKLIIEDAVAYGSTGGTIISNGGSPITSIGVCWSTLGLPTILDFKYTTG
jgi:hypothetical protein